ncbi:terminase, large subunit [Streptacidiphilus sp. N1-12]|uniref:Terminase, large subunit n=2 Tax=Streptacidiphilus alkalitolerans TaxID=3342712 RepID=A0ABV6WE84_9ACTN
MTVQQRITLARAAPDELRPHLAVLERRMYAERSPACLAEIVTGGKELQAPHLDLIDGAFQRIDAGEAERVGLFMPPRHGKSRRVRWAILWYLMLHPDRRIMLASYSATLAETHGRWLRDTIEANSELLGFGLRTSSHAAGRWDIENTEGGLLATGVGGAATGLGAHLFVIDDPVKGMLEAESLAYQSQTWGWWTGTAQTRLEPNGAVVLVQTLWSPGDLGTRVVEEEPDEWEIVRLPAIALTDDEYRALDLDPEPDPLGRQPGEALWPERYPASRLARIRRGVGEKVWWALFGQRPRPPKGTLISRDAMRAQRTTKPAAPQRVGVAVDPSGDGRDTAGIVAGYLGTDGRAYITHDLTEVMSTAEWSRQVCLVAHETGADFVVVETNYGGGMATFAVRTAWQALLDEGVVKGLPPRIVKVNAKRGKLLRAEPIAQQFTEDKIRLVGTFAQLEHEWSSWVPGAASPGRIDASAYLAYELLPVPGSSALISNPAKTPPRPGGRSSLTRPREGTGPRR